MKASQNFLNKDLGEQKRGVLKCNDNVSGIRCFVALGSNMGDSQGYLQKAIVDLKEHAEITGVEVSNFYKSKPHGPQNQPDYLNAAVSMYTQLAPESLLDVLQEIEINNDRVREGVIRWGARTLDLDLLFYGNESIKTKRLTVPHPRICERAFVLYPMRDLLGSKSAMRDLKTHDNHSILECTDQLSEMEKRNISAVALSNE